MPNNAFILDIGTPSLVPILLSTKSALLVLPSFHPHISDGARYTSENISNKNRIIVLPTSILYSSAVDLEIVLDILYYDLVLCRAWSRDTRQIPILVVYLYVD